MILAPTAMSTTNLMRHLRFQVPVQRDWIPDSSAIQHNKQSSFLHYHLRSCLSSPYFLARRASCILLRIKHVDTSWVGERLVACGSSKNGGSYISSRQHDILILMSKAFKNQFRDVVGGVRGFLKWRVLFDWIRFVSATSIRVQNA